MFFIRGFPLHVYLQWFCTGLFSSLPELIKVFHCTTFEQTFLPSEQMLIDSMCLVEWWKSENQIFVCPIGFGLVSSVLGCDAGRCALSWVPATTGLNGHHLLLLLRLKIYQHTIWSMAIQGPGVGSERRHKDWGWHWDRMTIQGWVQGWIFVGTRGEYWIFRDG